VGLKIIPIFVIPIFLDETQGNTRPDLLSSIGNFELFRSLHIVWQFDCAKLDNHGLVGFHNFVEKPHNGLARSLDGHSFDRGRANDEF